MNLLKRTHYSGDLCGNNIGQNVIVAGFVSIVRNLGKLLFIDLRDREGTIQLAFGENTDEEILKKALTLKAEWVIAAQGVVKERSSKNPNLKTGSIEIDVKDLRVFSRAAVPPFEICKDCNANEELRLKYRYLDLRHVDMMNNITMRHKIIKKMRDFYSDNGFIEIETPMLIKSTPEGARDYLVPSRVFKGRFFALPQSPQIYKQLTMISGFDKYFQVAKCFRDEDLRAQRQPEFTQLDVEMSFIDEKDVIEISEKMLENLFKDILDIELDLPFKRLSYNQAMERFGSDKPDLRFGMELVNLNGVLKNCDFKIFSDVILKNGAVYGVLAKGAQENFSRKNIDKLTAWIKDNYGVKGLSYTKIAKNGEVSSSYEKFLTEDQAQKVREIAACQPDDIMFVVCEEDKRRAQEAAGALRLELAKKLNLIDDKKFEFLWVTDFPLFEYSPEENRYVACHHPFTSPKMEDIENLNFRELHKIMARAYDIVLNGNEIGGGSIRINDPELQKKMLEMLGFSQKDANDQFGFLIDALSYGAPPHGGIAFGLDRLIMIMLGKDTIKDVIAFPKAQNSKELMSDAPQKVSKKQLAELDIMVKIKD